MEYRDSHTAENFGADYESSFFKENYKNYIYEWEKEVLQGIFEDLKPKNYLDFACGTGRITRLAEGYVEKITGIDVSESMISVAREQVKSGEFILQDVTEPSFESEVKYDFVSAFRFFTNAEESLRGEAMNSLLDLMTRDGYLLFNLHMNSTSSFALAARAYEQMFGEREGFNHLSLKQMGKELALIENFEIVSVHAKSVLPIIREGKERSRMMFRMIDSVESVCSYLPFQQFFSKYHIVLCRRK